MRITRIGLILGRIVLAFALLQLLSQIPLLHLFLCILPFSPALFPFSFVKLEVIAVSKKIYQFSSAKGSRSTKLHRIRVSKPGLERGVSSEVSRRVLLRGAEDAGPTLLVASLGRSPRRPRRGSHLPPLPLLFFLFVSLSEETLARKYTFSFFRFLSFLSRRKVRSGAVIGWLHLVHRRAYVNRAHLIRHFDSD